MNSTTIKTEYTADQIIMNAMNEVPEVQDQVSRKELWKLIAISSGIDFAMTAIDIGSFAATLGLSIAVEEIVEQFISTLIAKNKIELTWSDRAVGLLPVPGVTALSVRAVKELIRRRKK